MTGQKQPPSPNHKPVNNKMSENNFLLKQLQFNVAATDQLLKSALLWCGVLGRNRVSPVAVGEGVAQSPLSAQGKAGLDV